MSGPEKWEQDMSGCSNVFFLFIRLNQQSRPDGGDHAIDPLSLPHPNRLETNPA
jgi:hypothetical protein